MPTIIKLNNSTAQWNDEEDKWDSKDDDLEFLLNHNHNEHEIPAGGANPYPAQVAIDTAREIFPDIEILKIDKKPEYTPERVY